MWPSASVLTILLMELPDLEDVFARLYDVVVELIPESQRRKFWPGYMGNGAEEQSPDDAIDCPPHEQKKACSIYLGKDCESHKLQSAVSSRGMPNEKCRERDS